MKKYFEKKTKNNREQNKTIMKYTRSSEKLNKHTQNEKQIKQILALKMNKKQNRTLNVKNNKSNHDSLNIIINQKLNIETKEHELK